MGAMLVVVVVVEGRGAVVLTASVVGEKSPLTVVGGSVGTATVLIPVIIM